MRGVHLWSALLKIIKHVRVCVHRSWNRFEIMWYNDIGQLSMKNHQLIASILCSASVWYCCCACALVLFFQRIRLSIAYESNDRNTSNSINVLIDFHRKILSQLKRSHFGIALEAQCKTIIWSGFLASEYIKRAKYVSRSKRFSSIEWARNRHIYFVTVQYVREKQTRRRRKDGKNYPCILRNLRAFGKLV